MSDSKKYLRNGSISPLWQEAQYQKACEDHDMERFSQFLNSLPINYCSNVDEFVDKIYIGKINDETNTRDIEIKWNFE